jgi:non-heme chloroperoxidase
MTDNIFDLAKVMQEGFQGSVLIPFENAEHGLYYEQRDKVNAELVHFPGQASLVNKKDQ